MRTAALDGMGATIAGTLRPGDHGIREMIRNVTGIEPPTCPWRVYEDPVVQAAQVLRRRMTNGGVDLDAQPAIVLEAAELTSAIQDYIEAIDARSERERRDAEENMRRAAERGRQ